MADLPVPKAEAKPSTSDPRFEAALAALRAAPTAEGVDSAFMIGLWAGRAQAAADIRADRGSLDGLAWQERAAQLAEADLSDAPKLQSATTSLQETPEG